MISPEEITKLLDQLQARAKRAIEKNDSSQAIKLLGYHDQIKKWQNQEQADPVPVSAQELRKNGITLPANWDGVVEVSEPPPPDSAPVESLPATRPTDATASWEEQYSQAHALLRQAQYKAARDLFDQIRQHAATETLQNDAENGYRQAESQRKQQLKELEARAKKITQEQPEDFSAQKRAWKELENEAAETDIEFERAQNRLVELSQLAANQSVLQEVAELRRQIEEWQSLRQQFQQGERQGVDREELVRDYKKVLDLPAVLKVQQQVRELLTEYSHQPTIVSQLEQLQEELEGESGGLSLIGFIKDTMGYGATEIAAGRWENAYWELRRLRDAGVSVAYDPNLEVNRPVVELYTEACDGLAKFIIDKALDRQEKAQMAYREEHNPALAIDYSDEALAFFDKLPSAFPDQLRNDVLKTKEQVTEARRPYERDMAQWQMAQQKVEAAAHTGDHREALQLLREATVAWPDYPGLADMRREREESLANLVARRLRNAIDDAWAEIRQHQFETARAGLQQARQEASTIEKPSQDLTQAIEEVRQAERKVQEQENRYQTYQRLLKQARQALDKTPPDIRQAQTFLDELTEGERNRVEAIELLGRLADQRSDEENLAEAERAYERGDYEAAVLASERVSRDGSFGEKATWLLGRSQAMKLYQEKSVLRHTPGMLNQVKRAYEEIEQLLTRHGTDERTSPVLSKVRQELQEIAKLEESDQTVSRELTQIKEILKQAKANSVLVNRLTIIEEWEIAYQRAVALAKGETTLDNEIQQLITDIRSNWSADVSRQTQGLSPDDWDDYGQITTAWQMWEKLDLYGLLPDREAERQARRFEKRYCQLQVAHLKENRQLTPEILTTYQRLVELAEPHEELTIKQAAREAEIEVLCTQADQEMQQDASEKAVSLLSAKLLENEFAGEPALIGKLIEIHLDTKKFTEAETVAKRIKYSTRYDNRQQAEEAQKFWMGVIKSSQLFTEGKYDEGAVELEYLQNRIPGQSDRVKGYLHRLQDEAIEALIDEALQAKGRGEPIKAIKKYGRVLKLSQGNDIRASRGLENLQAEAIRAITEADQRVDTLNVNESSLAQLAAEATELQQLLESIEEVKEDLSLDNNIGTQLKKTQQRLADKLDKWQTILDRRKQFDTHFIQALENSWEFGQANSELNREQSHIAGESALQNHLKQRRELVKEATKLVETLNQHSKELITTIGGEDFDKVLEQCRSLEQAWRQAQQFDNRFGGLAGRIKHYYSEPEIDKDEVNTLNLHREIAQRQQQNLAQWEQWRDQLEGTYLKIEQTMEQLQKKAEALTPKEFQNLIDEVEVTCQRCQKLLETETPPEPLSNKARTVKSEVGSTDMRLEQISAWQKEAQEIAERRKAVKKALYDHYKEDDEGLICENGIILWIESEIKRGDAIPSRVREVDKLLTKAKELDPNNEAISQLKKTVEAWKSRPPSKKRGGLFGLFS